MNRNRLVRARHPPLSPKLTASDLYLFDKVEMALIEKTFNDDNKLFQCVIGALNPISRDKLETVFEEWFLQLDACVQQSGDYVE